MVIQLNIKPPKIDSPAPIGYPRVIRKHVITHHSTVSLLTGRAERIERIVTNKTYLVTKISSVVLYHWNRVYTALDFHLCSSLPKATSSEWSQGKASPRELKVTDLVLDCGCAWRIWISHFILDCYPINDFAFPSWEEWSQYQDLGYAKQLANSFDSLRHVRHRKTYKRTM